MDGSPHHASYGLVKRLRAQVMNGDLRNTFRRWYQGMKVSSDDPILRVA
jgi:hypothetical protein